MKAQSIRMVLLQFFLAFLAGCSGASYAPNDPWTWQAQYKSNPVGAEIFVDGQYVGTAPVTFNSPTMAFSSKRVVARLFPDNEQVVTCGPQTFEILFDFFNNRALVRGYPTAWHLVAETREVRFKSNTSSASLVDAIKEADLLSILRFIDRGSNVNEKLEGGRTPLCVAVETNNLTVVKALIEKVGPQLIRIRPMARFRCCKQFLPAITILPVNC